MTLQQVFRLKIHAVFFLNSRLDPFDARLGIPFRLVFERVKNTESRSNEAIKKRFISIYFYYTSYFVSVSLIGTVFIKLF